MNKIKKIKNSIMSKEDTYSYKGWIVSDFFLKRALAIFGYSIIAQFMLTIIFWLFMALVALSVYVINLF